MNLLTIILGLSSTGKSTSFRSLGPETVLYNTEKKMLPFKNNGIKVVVTDSVSDLLNKLAQFRGNSYPQITTIVIDSFTDYADLILAECKSKFKGFEVYNALNTKLHEFFQALKAIDNKFIFLTAHPEILQDVDGNTIFRTAISGKNKGNIERHATCVLCATTRQKAGGKGIDYVFLTNTDGKYPAKTPMGMYDVMYIENDVSKIIDAYTKYYAPTNQTLTAVKAA